MPQHDETRPDERAVELVHLTIDGEASPEQRQELNLLLSSSPPVRALHDSLMRLSSDLDALRLDPVPEDLRASILAAVRRRAQPAASPVVSHAASFAASPASDRRRMFAYAWAAAASLVLLLGIHTVVSSRRVPAGNVAPENVAGSMAPSTMSWPVVARFTARGVRVVVRRSEGLYALEPMPTGPAPSEVSLRWHPEQIRPLALTAGTAGRITKGGADFHPQPGSVPRIVVRRIAAPAEVSVLHAGKEALKFSLPAP